MHVLIISSEEYIPKQNPISGIFQHDQAKILKKNGQQVGVLSITFKYSFPTLFKSLLGQKTKHSQSMSVAQLFRLLILKFFNRKANSQWFEQIDGVDVLRYDGFWGFKKNRGSHSMMDMWMKHGAVALQKYSEKFGQPDVIHAHNMIYAGLFAIQIKSQFKVPVVITEHSSQYAMQGVGHQLETMLKERFKAQEHLYAVSPKLIELLEQKFKLAKNTFKWLPNVLDLKIEKIALNKEHHSSKKYRFVHVANLIPLKGQEELIRAFDAAFSLSDEVELIIAGKGKLESRLNKLILNLNRAHQIKLIGLIDRMEVVHQLDRADVLVLPSHYETFGVVLIEALSRGTPVISTYCGGPECIVRDEDGILVQPKNIEQLTAALKKMRTNPEKYNPIQLRSDCLKRFGESAFFTRVFNIYKEAIQFSSG